MSAEREAEQRVNRLLSAMPAPTSSRKSARTSGESGGIILGLDKQNAGEDKTTAGGLALGSDIKGTDGKANSSSATAIGGGFSFSSSSSAGTEKEATNKTVVEKSSTGPMSSGGGTFSFASSSNKEGQMTSAEAADRSQRLLQLRQLGLAGNINDFGLAAIDRVCNADVSEILFYCRLINDFVDRHVDEWTMKAHLREVQNASADFKKLVSERAPAFLVPYDA